MRRRHNCARVFTSIILAVGCRYSQSTADPNRGDTLDMKDMVLLSLQWHWIIPMLPADIAPAGTGDGVVDIHDLAMLADWWLWPQ